MAIGGSKGQFFSQINITPLTDVFLVLMVMMMLLAPITNVTGFTVFPPSPAVSRNYHGPRIKVEVAESGQIMINGNTLASPDTAQITAAIEVEQKKVGKKDIPLILICSPDATQKYVVAVMDAAAEAGIKELEFVQASLKRPGRA
jgi:biopolymer transport protein ExbD